jgi:hypothetical protein
VYLIANICIYTDKVYRLRRPSIKHLNSVGAYDASNPTKDWGFPDLGLSPHENSEGPLLEAETLTTTDRTQPLISKPFVPNTGHWKFKALALTKTKVSYRGRVCQRTL